MRDTSWRSAPDGAAPKSLAIDMKELRPVESVSETLKFLQSVQNRSESNNATYELDQLKIAIEDAERERAERAMRGGVTVTAHHSHTR